MDNIATEIEEYKIKFNIVENTSKLTNTNIIDLKKALKVIAMLQKDADLQKIDDVVNNTINDSKKLKKMFNELANNLPNVQKDGAEYNAFMSIICSIDTQIKAIGNN
jgi:aspartokinase